MSDAELLHRIQRGDASAWKVLYAHCLPGVWRYASALLRNTAAIEDVVSETMLALVRSVMRLEPDVCALHAWLRGVVRHKAGDYLRRQFREERALAVVGAHQSSHDVDDDPAAPMELEEHRHRIWEVLGRLQKVEQLALEWKYLDRLSVREIAARLGQSEKSVESTLYRARQEFRRLYEEHHAQSFAVAASRTNGRPHTRSTPDEMNPS